MRGSQLNPGGIQTRFIAPPPPADFERSAYGILTPKKSAPYGADFGVGLPRTNFGEADMNLRGYGGAPPHVIIALGGSVATNVVYRSTDGGATFSAVACPLGLWRYLTYSPTLQRFVSVETGNTLRDAMFSDDFGLTWTLVPNAMPVSGVGSPDFWRRTEWIDPLGVFVSSEYSNGAVAAHGDFLASSPDGIAWTRIDTGLTGTNGCAGVAYSSALGLLGLALNDVGANAARMGLTADLVAFSQITNPGGFPVDSFTVGEGNHGTVSNIAAIDPLGALVCGYVQVSAFDRAQWSRTTDGVALGVGQFLFANNSDVCGTAYSPELDRLLVNRSNNNAQSYALSDDGGVTYSIPTTGIASHDGTNIRWLPRAGLFFITFFDGATGRLASSPTGAGGTWTLIPTDLREFYDIAESS